MPAKFDISVVIIWSLVGVLSYLAWRKGDGAAWRGVRRGLEMFLINGPRVIVALLSAGFLSYILPKDHVAAWLGEGAGWQGIAIGAVVGPFFPGGPLVIFPVVVALIKAGAGLPAVVAFLTSASVWGAHRILMFEIPMMGMRFAVVRLLVSLPLPPLAGIIAAILVRTFGPPT